MDYAQGKRQSDRRILPFFSIVRPESKNAKIDRSDVNHTVRRARPKNRPHQKAISHLLGESAVHFSGGWIRRIATQGDGHEPKDLGTAGGRNARDRLFRRGDDGARSVLSTVLSKPS